MDGAVGGLEVVVVTGHGLRLAAQDTLIVTMNGAAQTVPTIQAILLRPPGHYTVGAKGDDSLRQCLRATALIEVDLIEGEITVLTATRIAGSRVDVLTVAGNRRLTAEDAAIAHRVLRATRNVGARHGASRPTVEGWYPDPTGRHEWRWYDGSAWAVLVHDEHGAGADPY